MALSLIAAKHQVVVFCYHSDFDDIPVRLIRDNRDLIMDDFYSSADLLIWHFGIFSEAFNCLMFGNGHASRVVCFHNVTPEQFVPESSRSMIRRSLEQTHLLPLADEIWPVSDINASAAIEAGVPPQRIFTMPLQVDAPAIFPLSAKAKDKIELLYVGRFAKAKGVIDLLEAYRRATGAGAPLARLTLAGNVAFSDQNYFKQIKEFIVEHDLGSSVEVAETIDDEALFGLYQRSHLLGIASYHEGFCKPVIEALRSGCIPVGYHSYNIPFAANGFGALVPPGDIAGLTDRLIALAKALASAMSRKAEPLLQLDRGATSIVDFEREVPAYVARYEGRMVKRHLKERVDSLTSDSVPGESKN